MVVTVKGPRTSSEEINFNSRYNGSANHDGPRALVEPMPQSNMINVNQPLSQELCDRVAEDLKRVTRQAIQLFQRVTLNMDMPPSVKSTMTQTLASSVLQAQQHLSLAAPPPMNPLAHAMMSQSMVPQHQPQQQQPNVTLGSHHGPAHSPLIDPCSERAVLKTINH